MKRLQLHLPHGYTTLHQVAAGWGFRSPRPPIASVEVCRLLDMCDLGPRELSRPDWKWSSEKDAV
ncbi:hypothetical protein PG990_011298 [Apiospora arundinis]